MMLKTINVKINDISKVELPSNIYQESFQPEESRFFESPSKVQHTRLIHKEKLELLVVPTQVRRHHSPYKPRECLLEWAE